VKGAAADEVVVEVVVVEVVVVEASHLMYGSVVAARRELNTSREEQERASLYLRRLIRYIRYTCLYLRRLTR